MGGLPYRKNQSRNLATRHSGDRTATQIQDSFLSQRVKMIESGTKLCSHPGVFGARVISISYTIHNSVGDCPGGESSEQR